MKSTKIDDGPILSLDMNGKWLFVATWKKTINIQVLVTENYYLVVNYTLVQVLFGLWENFSAAYHMCMIFPQSCVCVLSYF